MRTPTWAAIAISGLLGGVNACGPGNPTDDSGTDGAVAADVPHADGARSDGGSDARSADAAERADADSGVHPGQDAGPAPDSSISGDLPARYPANTIHSPITPTVVQNITNIIASHHRDPTQFMRMGDANCGAETMPFDPMNPLMQSLVGLPNASTFQTTMTYFEGTKVAATDPSGFCPAHTCSSWSWVGYFCNDNTLTATSAFDTSGGQTLLSQELAANPGAFAFIQFGGGEQDDLAPSTGLGSENVDVNGFGNMGFAQGIWELTDELIAQGVVPVLRGFPARWFPTNDMMCQHEPSGGYPPDSTPFTAAGTGLLMDTIRRGIAEARQIPVASFNVRAAQVPTTPPYTVDGCGLHLHQLSGGPGDFSDMRYGYPIDNLNILEQTARMRQVAQGTWAPEANPGPARTGSGTMSDPFIIDEVPFTDMHDLGAAQPSPITDYSSCCPSGQSVSSMDGNAYFYRLDVTDPSGVSVRISMTARYNSPVDHSAQAILRHFTTSATIANCTYSADENGTLVNNYYRFHLAPGTHYFTVASQRFTPTSTPAEVLLAVQPCTSDDLYCP